MGLEGQSATMEEVGAQDAELAPKAEEGIPEAPPARIRFGPRRVSPSELRERPDRFFRRTVNGRTLGETRELFRGKFQESAESLAGKRILVFGGGVSNYTADLRESGVEPGIVVNVDPYNAEVRQAIEASGGDRQVSDVGAEDCFATQRADLVQESNFDLVLLPFSVPHYSKTPEAVQMVLANAVRALRVGGVAYLTPLVVYSEGEYFDTSRDRQAALDQSLDRLAEIPGIEVEIDRQEGVAIIRKVAEDAVHPIESL